MADVTVKRVEDFEAIFGGGFRRVAGRPRRQLVRDRGDGPAAELPALSRARPDATTTRRRSTRPSPAGPRSTVGGEEYELEPGVFARVGPAEKRKLITGDEPARILADRGRLPGKVYEPPEFTDRGRRRDPDGQASLAKDEGRLAASGTGPRSAGRCMAAWRPGPSSAVTWWSEAGDDRAGDARVLVAHEVGRRGELVGDRDRASPRARAPARRAALASRRAASIPAQPIATSAWPSRQARPKLSATTTAGAAPDRLGDLARGCAAPTRRRPRAAARRGPLGRLEESMPALAQIQPAWVSVIRTPCAARTDHA